MKKYMKFLSVFLFLSFLITTSCKNDDDVPPPVDEVDGQDPDATDPDDPADDTPVETADYLALKAFYEDNPGNDLDWDIDDPSMKSWAGVSLNNDDRVTELRLNLRNVSKLVPEIGQLSELTGLFVSDNSIEEVPMEIGDLGKLLFLSLNNNSVSELPKEIGKLTNLEELEFTGNPLIVVAQEICDLGLTGTNIQKDDLRMVCEGTTGDHKALKALYEANPNTTVNWGNNINDVNMTGWDGVTVSVLNSRVTELELALASFDVIGPEIGDLEQLEYLNLALNSGLEISPEIGRLANLTELYLGSNFLGSNLSKEMPSEIFDLTNLEQLYLDNNELDEVPEGLSNLTKLKVLYLNNNEFSTMPEGLTSLTELQYLHLEHNQLPTIPKELARLDKLISMDLTSNPLDELPDEICEMYAAGVVVLSQNQINDGICQ